jgi:hypothetical protein
MLTAEDIAPHAIAACLEWPHEHADALWAWVKASPKDEHQALVAATDRLLATVHGMRDPRRVEKLWQHHRYKFFTPKTLVLGLELMLGEGLLDRTTATRLQDLVLEDTDKVGRWKD